MQTTQKMKKLIEAWWAASNRVGKLTEDLNRARQELDEAANELGEFLTPEGASYGEQFNIWINGELVGRPKGDVLICVRQTPTSGHAVELRNAKENAPQSD